jgi:hypothetical protein
MTTIFATDPIDSGEILHPDLVDTYVLDVGERTRNLSDYARSLPPVWGLRRSDATGEQPVYRPETIAVVDAVREWPTVPVPPLSTVYDGRAKRRRGGRHRAPVPAWAWLALGAGVVLLAEAAAVLGALAVLR